MIAPESLGFVESHELFRQGVRAFLQREVVPHADRWDRAGIIDKELFRRAGAAGLLAFDAPAEYGGGGIRDFRFNAIVTEEACAAGVAIHVSPLNLHNDVCLPYFLD